MVLDPLSAVSLASAIVQFVDFSTRLVSHASEIKEHGKPVESADLELRARQLQALSQKLALKLPRNSAPRPTASGAGGRNKQDDTILTIARSCEEIANELVSDLNKVQRKYANKAFKNFRAALAHVWREGYISALEAKLERYKSDLLTHLMVELTLIQRDQQPILSGMIDRAVRDGFEKDMPQPQLQSTRDAVLDSILEQADVPFISDRLWRYTYEGTRAERETEIINTLRFTAMETRKLSIPEAHQNSFTWALENVSHSNLATWLRDNDGIFWVSGKPGSGKSTLMKHIYEDEMTEKYLNAWAGEYRLVKSGFFFWSSGTSMQKSQLGLLRSVLEGLLSQFRDLIPTIFPERWNDTITSRRIIKPWSDHELLEALELFSSKLVDTARICLFIDGLDEFEGKPATLIKLVRVLARIPNVKLCISSRPWNEFENEYGHHSNRKVYMEQMNRSDILQYVSDTIGEHDHYQYLRRNGCQDIVTDIVDKSQGVFLWVYLVVRDLSQGLDNFDRALDIERRLLQMPADLKDFFKHMISSLDPIYRTPTAKAFQLAVHAERPMYMLNYFHLDMEEEDSAYAENMSLSPMKPQEISELSTLMTKRLNARSRGLLEPAKNVNVDFWFGPRVHFLHRTAKDWMESDEMQKMLEEWHSATDIDQMLLHVLLAQMKSVKIEEWHLTREGRVTDLIEHFFRCAGQIENETQTCPVHLVDQFAQVIEELQKTHCSTKAPAPWGFWGDSLGCTSFMDYATKKGLSLYSRAHGIETKCDEAESKSNAIPEPRRHRMLRYLEKFRTRGK